MDEMFAKVMMWMDRSHSLFHEYIPSPFIHVCVCIQYENDRPSFSPPIPPFLFLGKHKHKNSITF